MLCFIAETLKNTGVFLNMTALIKDMDVKNCTFYFSKAVSDIFFKKFFLHSIPFIIFSQWMRSFNTS